MQTRSLFAGKGIPLKRAILFSLSVLLCTSTLSAQQKSFPLEKRAAIEKAVAGFMSANSIPGLSAAVVLEGEPRWSQGFGMADLENSSPATRRARHCRAAKRKSTAFSGGRLQCGSYTSVTPPRVKHNSRFSSGFFRFLRILAHVLPVKNRLFCGP